MTDLVVPPSPENPGADPRWAAIAGQLNGGFGPFAPRPYLTSSDSVVYREKDRMAADARDASRSNPYGKSATRTMVDSVIGADLQLNLEPLADVLGVTDEQAQEWADLVEKTWNMAAKSPDFHMDAQRKQTFTSLMRTAYTTFYRDGEALGASVWKKSTNEQRTCLLLIEPERLSDPRGVHDIIKGRRMGVERDQHGAPIGYHIRQRHQNDGPFWGPIDYNKWKYYPRRNTFGRWNIFHFFDHDRSDMTRGISSFTTALLPMRLLNDYMMTELEAAATRATYAAVIQSKMNYEDAMKVIGPEMANAIGDNPILDFTMRMMTDRAQFYRGQDIHFGKAKIAHLLPDEELKLIQGQQHANGLKDYAAQNLYLIASALGVDYASLTKDYSSTNYSGARAALYDVWRSYEVRREAFVDGFAWPFFINWLEEMVALRGVIPMLGTKSFYEVKDALTFGTFETWSKPRLDPLKEGQADALMYHVGAMSLRDLCKIEGRDWRRVLKQRSIEKKQMETLDLEPWDIDPELLMNNPESKPDNSGGSQQ